MSNENEYEIARWFLSKPKGETVGISELIETGLLGADSPRKKAYQEIRKIPWLAGAFDQQVPLDESGVAGRGQAHQELLIRASKKRTKALSIQCTEFAGCSLSLLVSLDRKGQYRWMRISRLDAASIADGTERLRENQSNAFLIPSGALVSFFRRIKGLVSPDFRKDIELVLSIYYEETSRQIEEKNSSMKRLSEGLNHLDRLEAESIHIMREVMAFSENPVMLYSIGKDSAVLLHLAIKAFFPGKLPFPLLHVDTRWKFQEMYKFRSEVASLPEVEMLIHVNQDGVSKNINPIDHGSSLHTDIMKTQSLKQALDQHGFDVAFGGARRDEEKSRAKERIFSFRNELHSWDPKNQRPEFWSIYNQRKAPGQSIRVFPLSNWTELDIWQYIYEEKINIVPLYFAATRPVVLRGGQLIMVDDDRMQLLPGEHIEFEKIRFRTLGCYPLTAGVFSEASTIEDVLVELFESKTSEREGRVIDKDSASSMEKKKIEGYF